VPGLRGFPRRSRGEGLDGGSRIGGPGGRYPTRLASRALDGSRAGLETADAGVEGQVVDQGGGGGVAPRVPDGAGRSMAPVDVHPPRASHRRTGGSDLVATLAASRPRASPDRLQSPWTRANEEGAPNHPDTRTAHGAATSGEATRDRLGRGDPFQGEAGEERQGRIREGVRPRGTCRRNPAHPAPHLCVVARSVRCFVSSNRAFSWARRLEYD